MSDRTITVKGFSKAYSMTGWRLGYVAGPEWLMDPIIRILQYTSICASSISQHAGLRALQGDLDKPLVTEFAKRRRTVLDQIASIPELSCAEPNGAFYVMPTVPDGVDDDKTFVWSLLREVGGLQLSREVSLVQPGSIDFASHILVLSSNLNRGFDRIERWIDDQ